ncbi:MAG: single-stranded-DNA-specific exonuclease RecJ [Candidatus Taylorbacteria bacterium]|nr:single-stranded-DNA-specific exonuclease RecJ [Candidatus Taylorbacteria bacterium]
MKDYSVRPEISEEINKEFIKYPEILRKLLFYRGIKTLEEAENFLNPVFDNNHDPYLMKDMDKAVERIFNAISENEKVMIFSDYDADGIPGAVILHDFFKKIGFTNFENYIPHRVMEGFGLKEESIDEFAKNKVKLIITIDCGIADIKESKIIKKHKIDLIVTDHHEPKEELPEAIAILDPKQKDCEYPNKNICGAGVAFKLVQALVSKLSTFNFINFKPALLAPGYEKWLLDMVAIATVSDMVPLIGENRTLAYFGLKVLRKTPRVGLHKLLSILKIDLKNITEDDIGFMISPRINAASRMGEPEDAFILLSTNDEVEAGKMAIHLDKINNERKGIVAVMVKEIRKHWAKIDPDKKKKVLVAGNPDWKPSLLGLVANSLMDEHSGPVFLWGREEGKTLKGSCRSDGCVSIVEMMKDVEHLFLEYGGHSASGGFSVSLDKIDLLSDGLEIAYEKLSVKDTREKEIVADAVISIDDVNINFEKIVSQLAPFGIDNPKPIFALQNIEISEVRIFGKNNEHLEISFKNSSNPRTNFYQNKNLNGQGKVSAIGFFTKPTDFSAKIEVGEKIDLLANIEKSYFRGREELRLRIVDIF